MNLKPIPLFKIFGIQVSLDYSWFIVFFLLTFTLSKYFFPHFYPDYSFLTYLFVGALSAILYFGSVLLHELAHSLVAIKLNNKVSDIYLFIFGGVALKKEAQNPKEEFLVAVAGPLMSLFLALFFFILSILYPKDDIVKGILIYLKYANLVLGLFNIIPAFPLDGGRVLRAFLWSKKGILKATKISSNIGTLFSFFMIFNGALYFISGNLLYGTWLFVLGLFIYKIAKLSYENTKFHYLLSNYPVERYMVNVKPINYDTSVEEVLNYYYPFYQTKIIPVIGKDGLFYLINVDNVKNVKLTEKVDKYLKPIDCEVSPYQSLYDAHKLFLSCNEEELPVIYKNTFLGIIKRQDVEKILKTLAEKEGLDV